MVGHSSLACGSFSLPGHWRCACPWRPSLVRPGQTESSLCPSRLRGGSELAAIEKYAHCREDIAEVAITITAAIPTAVAAVAATAVSSSTTTATATKKQQQQNLHQQHQLQQKQEQDQQHLEEVVLDPELFSRLLRRGVHRINGVRHH